MLKKLIYKLKFARKINQITECGMLIGWHYASVFVFDHYWRQIGPDKAAIEYIEFLEADRIS